LEFIEGIFYVLDESRGIVRVTVSVPLWEVIDVML
jgi:hypothetical protein